MSDEYGDKLGEMERMIDGALPPGEKSIVFYSAYETSKATDNPLNNLKRVAIRGKVVDRKSTRLNSSHQIISYAVFCLKKKKTKSPNNSNDSQRTC